MDRLLLHPWADAVRGSSAKMQIGQNLINIPGETKNLIGQNRRKIIKGGVVYFKQKIGLWEYVSTHPSLLTPLPPIHLIFIMDFISRRLMINSTKIVSFYARLI
jgi:hypothetical protein